MLTVIAHDGDDDGRVSPTTRHTALSGTYGASIPQRREDGLRGLRVGNPSTSMGVSAAPTRRSAATSNPVSDARSPGSRST